MEETGEVTKNFKRISMSKLLPFLMTTLATTAGFATLPCPECHYPMEEVKATHRIAPVYSWEHHDEALYGYDFHLAGVEYHYMKDLGLNLTTGLHFNINNKEGFIKETIELTYKFGVTNWLKISPTASTEYTLHTFKNLNDRLLNISKYRALGGLELETNYLDVLSFKVKGEAFKDYNIFMIVKEADDMFFGRKYLYPMGYRITPTISWNVWNALTLETSGHYTSTLEVNNDVYTEHGVKASLIWSF